MGGPSMSDVALLGLQGHGWQVVSDRVLCWARSCLFFTLLT